MLLSRIIVENFKALHGRHQVQFEGMTALVGSNGTGKSALIDALAFGLGLGPVKSTSDSRFEGSVDALEIRELVNRSAKPAKAFVEIAFSNPTNEWTIRRTIQGRSSSIWLTTEGKQRELNLEELKDFVRNQLNLKSGSLDRIITHQHTSAQIAECSDQDLLLMMERLAGSDDVPQKLKMMVRA